MYPLDRSTTWRVTCTHTGAANQDHLADTITEFRYDLDGTQRADGHIAWDIQEHYYDDRIWYTVHATAR